MRNITHHFLALSFILCPAAVVLSGGGAPVSLDPASRLWVEGTSNVRDFTCTAESLTVTVAPNGDSAMIRRVAAGEKVITAVDVQVRAHSLDCAHNAKMTEHMLKAIKADENPVIEFRLTSYTMSSDSSAQVAKLDGTLTLGGTEKPVTIDARVQADSAGVLHVTGAYGMRMTDFGLKPPSLMLGAFKVRDPVVVHFDLQFND